MCCEKHWKTKYILCFEPGIASRDGGHIYYDDISGTIRSNPGDNRMTVLITVNDQGGGANVIGTERKLGRVL